MTNNTLSRTVVVSNLPPAATRDDIKNFMQFAGEIESIWEE